MRVLVAGFQHETNTFAPGSADWPAFERGDFFPPFAHGRAMLELHRTGGMPIRGFIESAGERAWQIEPSCWAGASPSAPVSRDAFERIEHTIASDVGHALRGGPLDGIYLDLHGAAVCEHLDRPECELLRTLRAQVGDAIPIVASVDLHANVDGDLLSLLDFVTAYRTYPHVDMVETGRRACRLLADRVARGTRSTVAFKRIPFLIPILSQSSLTGPGKAAYDRVTELDHESGGAPSFTTGFPAADVPHCGPTVWAYGESASALSEELFDCVVGSRGAWSLKLADAATVIEQAMKLGELHERPVVVADPQDNPGAGTDSQTTGLLWALIRARAGRRWPARVAIGFVNDPAVAEAASVVGVGETLTASLGRACLTWTGERSEPPVTGRFIVRALHAGEVTLTGPMMTGTKVDPGLCASLEFEGILVCVSSAKTQMLDRSLYRMLGIEASTMKLIVNKSAVHFRADFEPVASHVLVAKSAGQMAADPAELPWKRLRPGIETRC